MSREQLLRDALTVTAATKRMDVAMKRDDKKAMQRELALIHEASQRIMVAARSTPAGATLPSSDTHEDTAPAACSTQTIRSLRAAADSLAANYRDSLQTFNRFRSSIAIIQKTAGFAELPELLRKLQDIFGLTTCRLILSCDAYGEVASDHFPTFTDAELLEAHTELTCQGCERPYYMGPPTGLKGPERFLGDLAGSNGSCFVYPIIHCAEPDKPLGYITLLDNDPHRYAPDKATDFLEHFLCVLGQAIIDLLDKELITLTHALDDLTRVFTRGHLMRQGSRLIREAEANSMPLSVLFIDLDRFKPINDRYGHDAGDAVLMSVAATIKRFARKDDLVARLGGDEFVILLPHTDLPGAESFRRRLQSGLAELDLARIVPGAQRHDIGASIGVAVRAPRQDLASLIAEADQAMYDAKRRAQLSRNCPPASP